MGISIKLLHLLITALACVVVLCLRCFHRALLSNKCHGASKAIVTQANTPVGSKVTFDGEKRKPLQVTQALFSVFPKVTGHVVRSCITLHYITLQSPLFKGHSQSINVVLVYFLFCFV